MESRLNRIYLAVNIGNETPEIRLDLYDLSGRLMETLHNGSITSGRYEYTPAIKKSGIYFVVFSNNEVKSTKKMVLVR